MKRLFILSILLIMIVYNECNSKCDGKDILECPETKPDDPTKVCSYSNRDGEYQEVDKPSDQTSKNKDKESKSSNSATMIKITLFLLISISFI